MIRTVFLASLAGLVLATGAKAAEPYGTRVRVYPGSYAPVRTLDPDEVRDYQRDQLDRRQEMEREALRMQQKAERRALDLDD